jgi:hypothetical protein
LLALGRRQDITLIKALARAFRYQRMLDDGRYASSSEMAAAETLDRGYLGRLLQLTLLAPDIVEAIVEGRQVEGATLPGLMENVPLEWGNSATPEARRSEPPGISVGGRSDEPPIP